MPFQNSGNNALIGCVVVIVCLWVMGAQVNTRMDNPNIRYYSPNLEGDA